MDLDSGCVVIVICPFETSKQYRCFSDSGLLDACTVRDMLPHPAVATTKGITSEDKGSKNLMLSF